MADTEREQVLLKRSIYGALSIATVSVFFGFTTGSASITFDGMFSILDASLSGLAIFVLRLIGQNRSSRRFQYGYWHVEPLVLVFNGSLLTLLCVYAFINSVQNLLEGGHELQLDWAIVYAFIVTIICFCIYLKQKRMNVGLESPIIDLDVKGWMMSTSISAAIFLAFALAWFLQGTSFDYLIPYADSSILAVLILFVIPVPIKIVAGAIKEVLLITPDNLNENVDQLMQKLTEKYGFISYSQYVTRIGRGLFLEVYILLPESMEHVGISTLDGIRDEIEEALAEPDLDSWLSISFSRDKKWL